MAMSLSFGNPAVCRSQTGSFASPPHDGFAFIEPAVNHERDGSNVSL
jgi:hypothetical protein